MPTAPRADSSAAQLVPFAALSAAYFAHIGFFNPYLGLWLKSLDVPLLAIGVLASVQSFTRVFAPYLWAAVSDRTGERVRLLRISAAAALVSSLGLWFVQAPAWIGLVLLLLFLNTSSMMSLTEAATAHLVAGDWGRYGRVRLWGSAGFLVTVFVAGAWFERFGMAHFPAWAVATLGLVGLCCWRLPDLRESPRAHAQEPPPITRVVARPEVRWFLAALFFHVAAHFSIYVFLSLYLDELGYSKTWIGILWAVSVVVEIVWFFMQGRWMNRLRMEAWLLLCAAIAVLRFAMTAAWGAWLIVLLLAQALHAFTFAAHHTACIAFVSQHFPGPLRGRGQALFTVIGYGVGGLGGVLASGWLADRWGYQVLYAAATASALAAMFCAWRVSVWARRSGGPGATMDPSSRQEHPA